MDSFDWTLLGFLGIGFWVVSAAWFLTAIAVEIVRVYRAKPRRWGR